MTRFEMEIKGIIDEQIAKRTGKPNTGYWKKSAEREAAKLLEKSRDNIQVEPDGAAKWISSGNYLPEDVVEKLIYAGADFFSPEATAIKREEQDRLFIEDYRSQKHPLTDEMRAEMRAAFGEGETIVDVIFGERYTL